MEIAVGLLIAGLLALAVYLLFKRSEPQADKSTQPEAEGSKQINETLASLLSLNLTIRKAPLPSHLLAVAEEIIDKLMVLIPKVEDCDSPAGELAWSVKRIANSYLPDKCINPYLSLNEASRADEGILADFDSSLAALNTELDSVADMLNSRDISEFNNKAQFLKQRFNIKGHE